MMKRFTLTLIAMLGALALAACGQTLPTAEEIVDRMEAARDAMQDVKATVALDFSSPDDSGSMVGEVWMQKTDQTDEAGEPIYRSRLEVREASSAELGGTTFVSDGTTFWLYSPSENAVVTGSREDVKDEAPTSPMAMSETLQEIIQRGLDSVDLEVLGEEEVAGKNTWKVKVTPNSETSAEMQLDSLIEGEMWVDTELALPLKLNLDGSDIGSGTVEVRSIVVDGGISDDIFTFIVPEGAEVVQAADIAREMAPQSSTIDEARAAVSFTLLTPSVLPSDMVLVEVTLQGDSTVLQNYVGGETTLSLVQSTRPTGADREPPAGSNVEEVTVRGVTGELITSDDGSSSLLRWEENSVRIVVAGTVDGATALEVAEGLE
jgi:outer membrane lipoprotein-sorting protein